MRKPYGTDALNTFLERRYSEDQPRDEKGRFGEGTGDSKGKSAINKSWELQNTEDGPQKDWVEQGIAHVENVPIENVKVEAYDHEKITQYKEDFKNGSTFPMPKGRKDSDTGEVVITGGHHRVTAWKELGHDKVPVVLASPDTV